MRALFVAMVAIGVTALLGVAEVKAQAASMSMSSGGGSASAGAAGMGSVGGWSLAPEPSVKRKPTVGGTKVVTATSGRMTGTAGAWSVAPSLAMSEPLFGKGAPARGAGVDAKSSPQAASGAVPAPEPVSAPSGGRPAPEQPDTKSAKK